MIALHGRSGGAITKSHTLLLILVGIQVTLTLALLVKLGSFESSREAVVNPAPPPPTSANAAAVPDESSLIADDTRLGEYQLRRIIREEISRVVPAYNNAKTEQALSEPLLDQAEMQYQRRLVVQELEALKGQAEVSTAELDKLLGDIARLDPQSRSELLGMFNRAMNKGEIRGNL